MPHSSFNLKKCKRKYIQVKAYIIYYTYLNKKTGDFYITKTFHIGELLGLGNMFYTEKEAYIFGIHLLTDWLTHDNPDSLKQKIRKNLDKYLYFNKKHKLIFQREVEYE